MIKSECICMTLWGFQYHWLRMKCPVHKHLPLFSKIDGLTRVRPLTPEAFPVARILRRDVPKLKPGIFGWRWIWDGNGWRHKESFFGAARCPMGMHPKATSATPTTTVDFPPAKRDRDVMAFVMWWDGMKEDPDELRYCIDAIWIPDPLPSVTIYGK